MQRSFVFGLLIAASLLASKPVEAQQTQFRADWLFLRRDNDAGSQRLINGPDQFNSTADFDFESGYRLFFSLGTNNFDVEFQYSRLDEWQDQTNMRLSNELSFDNEFNNAFVIAAPPANTLAFNSILFTASEYTDGGAIDETTEGELLNAFSTLTYEAKTWYRDYEVTVKTTRENWFRFGIGYRHIDFDESNGLRIGGVFSAIDADDGALPGDATNDDNDSLSNDALVANGLVFASGTADGFAHGDGLILGYDSNNTNQLDGAQITVDATVVEGEFFLLDVFSNIGIFHNQIKARLTETYTGFGTNDSVYSAEYRGSENDLAWAFQAGLRGALKLTNSLRLTGGYEALYIDGLALGPNMGTLTTFSTLPVRAKDSALIHGGKLGLELVW